MEIVKITPRGYCHGVVNAINTITKIDQKSTKKPIYILGMVIHNKMVVESFREKGVITLHDPSKSRSELLDLIDEGTVVFTAHGVSPKVVQKAKDKGLDIIDTTCKDVIKSQTVVNDYLSQGYDIIYIGKKGHPESEASREISERVHLITDVEELQDVVIDNPLVALTNQTTMSIFDVYNIAEKAKDFYPNIVFIDEICNATRIRQEGIMKQDESIDHCFIVGDQMSNNSIKLAAVSKEKANIDSTLIERVSDIDIEKLKTYNKVSISSGASTPTQVTNEVIEFLSKFDREDPSTWDNRSKINSTNLFKKSTS